MASVAGRKKSLISPANVQIDIPVGTNTLLNKAASQSTSLYQQCSALRSRLLRVHGFAHFFALSSPSGSFRSSAEVVNTVWDCFALGTPLCYLFNLLPDPITHIDIETDPRSVEVDNERAKKRAIALFAIQVKQLNHGEQFTVTDLWDRTNSDGFVKVVNTVTHLVDILPPDVFEEAPPSSPPSTNDSFDSVGTDTPAISTPANGPDIERNNIIRELVETERKYVQDLEVMQKYAQELSQSNTLDRDTIHLLFPNLNKLLNFQRRFLIRLEGTADMLWREQRWGLLFTDNEEEFAVYEPYCANYTNASELMLMEEQNLVKYNHLINAKSELPAFLIKPVQRICKYPLLLDQLLKKSSPIDYPYYEELKAGSAAAKRITDKINEAQRRAENVLTVQNLASRVDDWKGHHVSQFGELLLDDVFIVTKSEVDREYHVFLFERIILCCKEDTSVAGSSRKGGKSNSILKKPNGPVLSGLAGGSKKKMTPLLLKGRIYLNNVTDARVVQPGSYSLNIWWKGDDDLEFFTLRCRNEEQVKQWEAVVKRLIEKVAMRRASERSSSRLAHLSNPNGYNSPNLRNGTPDRGFPSNPVPSISSHPYANGSRAYRQSTPYEDHVVGNGSSGYAGGSPGYPLHGGFDLDDDLEDHPAANIHPTSGRATPLDGRRGVMAPGFDQYYGYERPRALTEDANGPALAQWRSNVPGLPSGPSPRTLAHMGSTTSYASEPGFGVGPRANTGRPQLRTQYSSSRLRPPHESGEPRDATSPLSTAPVVSPLSRTRSASQPSAYVPVAAAAVPPLPSNGWDRTQGSTSTTTKRSSSSSQSTGDDSTYSPNSLSPITPFGSSDSSLSGTVGRSSTLYEVPVKVKVYFGTDIFVIQVARATDYGELVERVGKKIRLCGPRRDNGPLRVKYEDEEGDLISMRSTEDVEMAFGDKTQVVLHVA